MYRYIDNAVRLNINEMFAEALRATRIEMSDAEKKAQDIETYGLFTYEDFGGMIPEIAFEAFNGAYLKVAMGKGMIDWATIEMYANRYIPLM